MSERLDELFDESIELMHRYGRYLLQDSDNEEEEELQEFNEAFSEICDLREKYVTQESVFQDFMKQIENLPQEIDEEELFARYQSELDKRLEVLKLGEDNELYKQFKELISNAKSKSHDDSEVATVSENVNTVDPITKLPLKDPVKNVKCGHVYEKSTILQLIKSKKEVKCPIPGCVAASCVQEEDLVADLALKLHCDTNKI